MQIFSHECYNQGKWMIENVKTFPTRNLKMSVKSLELTWKLLKYQVIRIGYTGFGKTDTEKIS